MKWEKHWITFIIKDSLVKSTSKRKHSNISYQVMKSHTKIFDFVMKDHERMYIVFNSVDGIVTSRYGELMECA